MSSRFSDAYHVAVSELRENKEQWQAFESTGNCVVLAGPGSGKTKVLTTKVTRMLVEDIHAPRGLACLTYSNECVRELERRLRRLGVEERTNLFVGTVHSFCLVNLLRPFAAPAGLEMAPPYRVASFEQQETFLQKALDELVSTSERASRFRIQLDKLRRTELDRTSTEWRSRLGRVALRYEQLLKENRLVDFDGIVLFGLNLLNRDWVARSIQARFPVLVVDEYQDLGQPLHELVIRLLDFGVRIFVVGDPDQSIYGFTGAKPELLTELATREDVESVTLRLNYRCGQRIVQAATLTLEEERDYEAGGDHEGAVFFHKIDGAIAGQANGIFQDLLPAVRKRHPKTPLNEIAILYHTKFDGTDIASAADAAKVEYVRVDGDATYKKTPLTRWIEDCAAWCAEGWMKGEPRLSTVLRKWVNWHAATPLTSKDRVGLKRNLVQFLFTHRDPSFSARDWLDGLLNAGLATVLKLPDMTDEWPAVDGLKKALALPKGRLRTMTVRGLAGQVGREDHLNLITLHSVKGREFDVVFLVGCDEGRFRAADSQSRNLFYVGLTRARYEVHMVYSGYYERGGRRYQEGPAKFLVDLARKLKGAK